MTFGRLLKRPLAPDVADAFLRPAQTDPGIRRDLAAVLRGIDRRHTQRAAERFGEVEVPVLLAWAPEDRCFPLRHAERMAAAFPGGPAGADRGQLHVRVCRPAGAHGRADRLLRPRLSEHLAAA